VAPSVQRRKVWLTPTTRVPCSDAAKIGERKLGRKVNVAPGKIPLWDKNPRKCICKCICTSPGDGQISCKVWFASVQRRRCSNETKTRNPLKFAGVPQINETISAPSGPKFTILSGHVEEILLFKIFFPIVDKCLSCEDIARQSCTMVPR